jgi:hypothetical protein
MGEETTECPGALLEQTRRDDKTIKLVLFFIVGVGFGLGCGSVVGRSGAVMETKI